MGEFSEAIFLRSKTMKLNGFWGLFAFVNGQDEKGVDGELAPRRYSDLLAITLHYAPDFEERKYWAYGCNCLILGDRPMSEMGKGKPVDEMDVACKEYKSCQKCVRMEFGDDCIGEREKYSWK